MIAFTLLICFAVVNGNGIHPDAHQPQPYSFGYTIKDKESVQHRQETGNGAGTVHGNYGFIDNKGLRRQVDYVADHGGFRAAIHTNEPGTSGQSPAAVHMKSNDPYAHGAAAPYVSRVNDPVVSALYESDGVLGFPTLYGHRAYGHGSHQYVPSPDRHLFLSPVHTHMPLHVSERHPGHHFPVIHEIDHPHVSAHVPVHGHLALVPLHHHASFDGLPNSHLHGPAYMGEQRLGPYPGHGGIVNFGANLVGGVIKGYDSRFTNLS